MANVTEDREKLTRRAVLDSTIIPLAGDNPRGQPAPAGFEGIGAADPLDQQVDPQLQALTDILGANDSGGLQFDPPAEELGIEDAATPAAVDQTGEMVKKNMQTEETNGEQPLRDKTKPKSKMDNALDIMDRRDGAFPIENKGKLMAIMAGTILQMIGLNNGAPGLMLAGGTISGLAQGELQKWNERWDAEMANVLDDTKTKTTYAQEASDSVRIQRDIDDKKGPAKTVAEADDRLLKAGVQQTPENRERMMTGTPSSDVSETERKKQEYRDRLKPQVKDQFVAKQKKEGTYDQFGTWPEEKRVEAVEAFANDLEVGIIPGGDKPATAPVPEVGYLIPEDYADIANDISGGKTAVKSESDVSDPKKEYSHTAEVVRKNSPLRDTPPEEANSASFTITPKYENHPLLHGLPTGEVNIKEVGVAMKKNIEKYGEARTAENGKRYFYFPRTEARGVESVGEFFSPSARVKNARDAHWVKVFDTPLEPIGGVSDNDYEKQKLQEVLEGKREFSSEMSAYMDLIYTASYGIDG